jgi:surface polysaccharide O-acyltransferase-like enzyme
MARINNKIQMKNRIFTILLVLLVAMLTISCADVAHVTFTNPNEQIYGFWGGTWHGMIMFPSFIGSLIWDDIAVYAIHNNGAWYNFGFVGGFFIMLKILVQILKLISGR